MTATNSFVSSLFKMVKFIFLVVQRKYLLNLLTNLLLLSRHQCGTTTDE